MMRRRSRDFRYVRSPDGSSDRGDNAAPAFTSAAKAASATTKRERGDDEPLLMKIRGYPNEFTSCIIRPRS